MPGDARHVRCSHGIARPLGAHGVPGRSVLRPSSPGWWPASAAGFRPQLAAPSSSALSAPGPIAGTIFVANAGAIGHRAGGTGPGSITVVPPLTPPATHIPKRSSPKG